MPSRVIARWIKPIKCLKHAHSLTIAFLLAFWFCSFARNAMGFSEQSIQSRDILSRLVDYTIPQLMPFIQCEIILQCNSIKIRLNLQFCIRCEFIFKCIGDWKAEGKESKWKKLQVTAKIFHACSLVTIIFI